MPARISASEREKFLAGRHVAVLVTIAADGSPVPTPIWYAYRKGAFYFRTAASAAKTENVRRDPRVSICIQDERPPYKALIVYGRAEIADGEEWLATAMPRRYLGYVGGIGYRAAAREQIEAGPEVTLVVRPERTASFDFSSDTPAVGRIWLLLKRVLPPWI
jgi:PPOX class probable F420-dependent enzyme